MFNKKQKEECALALGLSLEELDAFARRYRGHLNKHLKHESLSINIILLGFSLLKKVKEASEQPPKPQINFGTLSNEALKKYGVEILELSREGYGATRLCKAMRERHNAVISKSTMERFLRLNKEEVKHGKSTGEQ
ncbi:MAG: hypothetical protein JXK05_09720 [Campylobacterales bacterium]|nr:hypothetical protein [Campylobacterales bacterium]